MSFWMNTRMYAGIFVVTGLGWTPFLMRFRSQWQL